MTSAARPEISDRRPACRQQDRRTISLRSCSAHADNYASRLFARALHVDTRIPRAADGTNRIGGDRLAAAMTVGPGWPRSGGVTGPRQPEPEIFRCCVVRPVLRRRSAGEIAGRRDHLDSSWPGGVACDFAYNFFDKHGRLVPVAIPGDQSILSAGCLSMLSTRPDARVVLVAGGRQKVGTIRLVLEAKLCNTLVTDTATARELMGKATRRARSPRYARGARA